MARINQGPRVPHGARQVKLILPSTARLEPRRHDRDGEAVIELYAPGTAGSSATPADTVERCTDELGKREFIMYTFKEPNPCTTTN